MDVWYLILYSFCLFTGVKSELFNESSLTPSYENFTDASIKLSEEKYSEEFRAFISGNTTEAPPVVSYQKRAEAYPVNVLVMGESNPATLPFRWDKIMPAVDIAMEGITARYKDYINFTFVREPVGCYAEDVNAKIADFRCDRSVGVIIGPGCTNAVAAAAIITTYWKIPIISPAALGLFDTSPYSYLTKVSPYSCPSYANAAISFLKENKWTHIAIIYNEESAVAKIFYDTFDAFLGEESNFFHWTYGFTKNKKNELKFILTDATYRCRVILVFAENPELRDVMLAAHSLGLTTSGDYVFIILRTLSSSVPEVSLWKNGVNEAEDSKMLEALGHAVFLYTGRPDYEDIDFIQQVVNRSFNDYGYTYEKDERVSLYIPAYHNALTIYAKVLNETLAAGQDPLDAKNIVNRLWNRTFEGVNEAFRINQQGETVANISFACFDVNTGQVETIALWYHQTNTIFSPWARSFPWPYNAGVPPADRPDCGYAGELCNQDDFPVAIIASVVTLFVIFVIIGGAVVFIVYRTSKKNAEKELWWWRIRVSDLTPVNTAFMPSLASIQGSKMLRSSVNSNSQTSMRLGRLIDVDVALWKSQLVKLKKLNLNNCPISRTLLLEFKTLRELSHPNLVTIHGACLEQDPEALVMEYCMKGSLQDLLGNLAVSLDSQFKFSLIMDIINGLCYLHESPVRVHGRLNSDVCLIDNRFTVKLSEFGLPTIYNSLNIDTSEHEYKRTRLWVAPELLRVIRPTHATKEGDVYSFAIILLEVLTRDAPYCLEGDFLTVDEMLTKIMAGCSPPFRPSIELPAKLQDMQYLIEKCWKEDPKDRPSARHIHHCVKNIASSMGEKGNLLDNLMRRMELYANNLEKLVDDKTVELREEKKKSEELLYQILPRSVADRLKAGLRVEPMAYENVTVYFSDVVGFTALSSRSSPLEVVTLLNDMYTCFDAIIEEFDVYKVETIGDAYMVVSGLPQQNGDQHVLEIAKFSMKILLAVEKFQIRHLPDENLQIRIGIHSGPVCAGVVGLKMPRYCLFGDTVNTASRMESTGEAMKIHISSEVKRLLERLGQFNFIPRGNLFIKGKGQMFTYWLLEECLDTPKVKTPAPDTCYSYNSIGLPGTSTMEHDA